MTGTNKKSGDKLSVSSTKTLTLKRGGVEQGVVRQSFSHGRTKAVVVEKVKRRLPGPGDGRTHEAPHSAAPAVARRGTAAPKPTSKPAAAPAAAPRGAPRGAPGGKPSGVVLRTLTEEERSARAHALADSRL